MFAELVLFPKACPKKRLSNHDKQEYLDTGYDFQKAKCMQRVELATYRVNATAFNFISFIHVS